MFGFLLTAWSGVEIRESTSTWSDRWPLRLIRTLTGEFIVFSREQWWQCNNIFARYWGVTWKYNESSREKLPKSIAVPPTAHTVSDMRSNRVSIKCLCEYKWRHRGDFSISSYLRRYRLQKGLNQAFFNTLQNSKFWPFQELYLMNWAESSKSLRWRHLY